MKRKTINRKPLHLWFEGCFKMYGSDFKTIQKVVEDYGYFFSIEEIEKLYNSYKEGLLLKTEILLK